MGKKQKMKKAAAAAKAAAGDAAKNKNDHSCCSGSGSACSDAGCCVKGKCAESSNSKTDLSSVNMQNLMTLAENLQTSPSGKCKSQKSSGSGSSASDSSDSDDAPDSLPGEAAGAAGGRELQQQKQSGDGPSEVFAIPKYSRGEKKARRLLMKLDLEPVPNVSRVTMRKAKNVLLCIDQPEVFKCPNSKTLICFGEVRIDNASNAAAAQAAERYINDVNVHTPQMQKDGSEGLLEDQEGEEVDIEALGSELDEKDIELVQMQAGCTRLTAIKALIKHKSDVVNAIMELTVGVDI